MEVVTEKSSDFECKNNNLHLKWETASAFYVFHGPDWIICEMFLQEHFFNSVRISHPLFRTVLGAHNVPAGTFLFIFAHFTRIARTDTIPQTTPTG